MPTAPSPLPNAPIDEGTSFDRLRFAVLALETTGYRAVHHRVVELAVMHIDGGSSRLVFDSMIRPDRRMSHREVHGISSRDVQSAPTMQEVAGAVADALAGRVLVADHAAFDLPFLHNELTPLGMRWPLPSLCTWSLQRAFGQGSPTVDPSTRGMHVAHEDARRTAQSLSFHLTTLRARGISTLGQLRQAAPAATWFDGAGPLTAAEAAAVEGRAPAVPRPGPPRPARRAPDPERYVALLMAQLGEAPTPAQLEALRHLAAPLPRDTLAAKHARVAGRWLVAEAVSGTIGGPQRQRIHRAFDLLSAMGWAPGDDRREPAHGRLDGRAGHPMAGRQAAAPQQDLERVVRGPGER